MEIWGVSHRSDCRTAEVLLRKRIAKLLRYCRIMHMIHKNELPRMGAQGESRHGRRVSTVLSGIETLKSIIRTVSWQHSVANEGVPTLHGSPLRLFTPHYVVSSILTAQHQEPHTSMHWTFLQHCLSE